MKYLLLPLLIILVPISAYGEIKYNPYVFETPLICMSGADKDVSLTHNEMLEIVSDGISAWTKKLHAVTDSQWSIYIATGVCDYNVIFRGNVINGTLGAITYFSQGSAIEIYTIKNDKPLDRDVINNVMIHEIGHMFGLGHSSDKRSTMYPFSNTNDVNDNDLLAVILKYGTDGWGGYTNNELKYMDFG